MGVLRTYAAQAAEVMLKRILWDIGGVINPLIQSGFLNKSNYITNPSQAAFNQNRGEKISCIRMPYYNSAVRDTFEDFSFDSFVGSGMMKASAKMKMLITESDGGGTTISHRALTGDSGDITGGNSVLESMIISSDLALQYGIQKTILKEIFASNWVKNEGDANGSEGVETTFELETRALKTQTTDLSNVTSPTSSIRSLLKELNAAAESMSLTCNAVYVILPTPAYTSYASLLQPGGMGQPNYHNATNTDGTKNGYGSSYFSFENFIFVNMDKICFSTYTPAASKKITIAGAEVTPLAGLTYKALILPSSAIVVCNPAIPTLESVMVDGVSVLETEQMRAALADIGMYSADGGLTEERDAALLDPFLYDAIQKRGGKIDEFSANTRRLVIRDFPPSANATSLSKLVAMETSIGVVRSQPQMVQQWDVPEALL